jgi:hypothetical protein
MTKPLPPLLADFDWSVATWEGSRREQMRRWAALPLDQIIAAIEEMESLTDALHASPTPATPSGSDTPPRASAV